MTIKHIESFEDEFGISKVDCQSVGGEWPGLVIDIAGADERGYYDNLMDRTIFIPDDYGENGAVRSNDGWHLCECPADMDADTFREEIGMCDKSATEDEIEESVREICGKTGIFYSPREEAEAVEEEERANVLHELEANGFQQLELVKDEPFYLVESDGSSRVYYVCGAAPTTGPMFIHTSDGAPEVFPTWSSCYDSISR